MVYEYHIVVFGSLFLCSPFTWGKRYETRLYYGELIWFIQSSMRQDKLRAQGGHDLNELSRMKGGMPC
jgi:hypothetical protein